MAVGVGGMGIMGRLRRWRMIEVVWEEYMGSGKGKGVCGLKIVFKDAVGNGVLGVVRIVGRVVGSILRGSFVIEKIFGTGGMGT